MDFKVPLRPARRLGGALLALALLVALAAPAHAAPRGEAPFFASVWGLLSALWAEAGFVVDPDGQPAEEGFVVDPGGRSQPAALFSNVGFEVDPSGFTAPLPPPPGNVGFEVDPNG
ncbi:MAG TPA: hypothetical protein VGS22_15535 [Thermoanaerobaculia bacterium]|nr:hypothetical protein [Thermoanaerobaculia bacterium]